MARSFNKSIKEINPEFSKKGLILKQNLSVLWSPHAKNTLIAKDPDAGKD